MARVYWDPLHVIMCCLFIIIIIFMSVMSPAPETLFLESVGGEQESFEEIKNGKVLVLLATVVSLPSLPVKDTRGTLPVIIIFILY